MLQVRDVVLSLKKGPNLGDGTWLTTEVEFLLFGSLVPLFFFQHSSFNLRSLSLLLFLTFFYILIIPNSITMRSLQELYDQPPSSPRQASPSSTQEEDGIAPLFSHASPRSLSPSQSADEGNTDADANVMSLLQTSRKRPADLSQFADMISREKKFKSEDKKDLLRFASVSHFLFDAVSFSHHVHPFRNQRQNKQFSSIPN